MWAGRIPGAGSGLAAADALSSLAVAYMNRRMVDELNIEVTGDILDHAQILDLAFFEDPLRQDLIARTQSNTAVHLQTFVAESLAAVRHLLSAASLLAVLVLIDPLVLVVVPPFAIPFLYFQAKLARQRFTEEHQRAEKRRWTSYFVSKLTSSDSVAEVRLLGLGPLLAQRFRTLLREFRDRDRQLHLRNFRGTAVAALLTIAALYAIFVRVALRSLTGTASLGDLAIFGGAAVRLRLALNGRSAPVRAHSNAFSSWKTSASSWVRRRRWRPGPCCDPRWTAARSGSRTSHSPIPERLSPCCVASPSRSRQG